MGNRVIVWFSSGAASAVAAKISVQLFKDRLVEVVNVNMDADEHEDNARFRDEVSKWIGQEIIETRSTRYKSTDEVFLRERYIAGVTGAACTKHLKRKVQQAYQRIGDELVVGFTADEEDRITNLQERWPNEKFLWVLKDAGITKEDCYHILTAANIELPAMYRLGYGHNNCIGCVKGGKGYWNKIRRDFPEVFARRAAVERNIGFPILRDTWLDELDPLVGRDQPEPKIECGLFCENYTQLVQL